MNRVIIQHHNNNKHDKNGPMANLSIIYILKIFLNLLLLLIFIILLHSLYVFVSWLIHCNDLNNAPDVVVCWCCCLFFSFYNASNIQNQIVLHSTVSMYDSFNTGFGTVAVGVKFDNHVRRLCGPQVYKYPLVWRTAAPKQRIKYKQTK